MKKVLIVEGMMCEHCKGAVTGALERVAGVESVKVDLKKKTAVVKSRDEISDVLLLSAVREAGYEASVQ